MNTTPLSYYHLHQPLSLVRTLNGHCDSIVTDTDIMIGPHGAGLMHNIFMRDRYVTRTAAVD
jgi:hypothetical protein